jgi:signal peptidase
MKHKAANIIGIVLCVLLLPIVVVNVTLAVESYTQPGKVAMFAGFGPLIVETGSMRPVFAENDVIIVKKTDASALKSNDIIAYYDHKGIVVSHRIIGYKKDDSGARLYITKGDANNVQDETPVPAAQVVGLVVNVLPNGGKVLRFIGQPLMTVLVIGVPLGLFFGIEALVRAVSKRRRKEELPGTLEMAAQEPEE